LASKTIAMPSDLNKLRTLLHKVPLPQKLESLYRGFMLIAEHYEGWTNHIR